MKANGGHKEKRTKDPFFFFCQSRLRGLCLSHSNIKVEAGLHAGTVNRSGAF